MQIRPETEPKNDAIMLCKIGNGTLGNVVISGNKVINGTALMAFYNPIGFTMADGATLATVAAARIFEPPHFIKLKKRGFKVDLLVKVLTITAAL